MSKEEEARTIAPPLRSLPAEMIRGLRVRPSVVKMMDEVSDYEGQSRSTMLRKIVSGYVENGTDAPFPEQRDSRLNGWIKPETWEAAVDRAQEEGRSFIDVVEHEIGKLFDELPPYEDEVNEEDDGLDDDPLIYDDTAEG